MSSTFKNLLVDTGILYKKIWRKSLFLASVFIGISFLLDFIFWNNEFLMNNLIMNYSVGLYSLIDSILYMMILLLFVITLVVTIRTIHVYDNGWKENILQSYKYAMKILPSYITIKAIYIIFICLWSLVLIVPGIVYLIRHSLAGVASIVDGKKGRDALDFSRRLVVPYFGQYCGFIITVCVIAFAFTAPLWFIADILVFVVLPKEEMIISNIIIFIQNVFIFAAIVYLLTAAYSSYKYFKLKLQDS